MKMRIINKKHIVFSGDFPENTTPNKAYKVLLKKVTESPFAWVKSVLVEKFGKNLNPAFLGGDWSESWNIDNINFELTMYYNEDGTSIRLDIESEI